MPCSLSNSKKVVLDRRDISKPKPRGHGSPGAARAHGYGDEDLVRLEEGPDDVLSREGTLGVGITRTLPHEFMSLSLNQVLHSWAKSAACGEQHLNEREGRDPEGE